MKKILIFLGTRPEALKLLPVYLELKKVKQWDTRLVSTGQHREMLKGVLDFFGVEADIDFKLMKPDQSLDQLTASILRESSDLIDSVAPDLVVVQGDTTTCFAVSLAAYYKKIFVAHVEAGLRSYDLSSPFPEEANRRMTALLAQFHFAPTKGAVKSLKAERVAGKIFLTGNTVIDSLLMARARVKKNPPLLPIKWNSKRMVLITVHRRESFGVPFANICSAILSLSRKFTDVSFVYPVHLNPRIREFAFEKLGHLPNLHLIEPVAYGEMVSLMMQAHLILTDSGGIQEEAPSLGKPVIVLRDVTERPEAIKAGCSILGGTSERRIITLASQLLTDQRKYMKMARIKNPYGKGDSAIKIAGILKRALG